MQLAQKKKRSKKIESLEQGCDWWNPVRSNKIQKVEKNAAREPKQTTIPIESEIT